MPTYTYTCTACNDVIEKRQSFSDPPLTTCEQCGGQLRKIIHPVGIVFKGSGWYITDSRSSSKSANGGSSATPAGSTSDKSGSDASTGSPSDGDKSSPASTSSTSSGTAPASSSSSSTSSGTADKS